MAKKRLEEISTIERISDILQKRHKISIKKIHLSYSISYVKDYYNKINTIEGYENCIENFPHYELHEYAINNMYLLTDKNENNLIKFIHKFSFSNKNETKIWNINGSSLLYNPLNFMAML